MATLAELAKEHHNPGLVKPDMSPNGNTQILIFNDGEIVSTKGGRAFMMRSLISHFPPIIVDHKCLAAFPEPYGADGLSYAIVKDLKTACTIRDAIKASK